MTNWRRGLAWFALALTSLLAMLVLTAPAGLMTYLMDMGTNGRFHLVDAEGSAWSGRGRLISVRGPETLALDWQLEASSLWRGGLTWHLGLDGKPMTLRVNPWRWEIDAGSLRIPIGMFRGFLPAVVHGYTLKGQIVLDGRGLGRSWSGTQGSGTARLEILALSVRELFQGTAGSYGVDIRPVGTALEFGLATLEGPLRLEGRGSLDAGRIDCELAARLDNTGSQELANLMDHLAARDGPRGWKFRCQR